MKNAEQWTIASRGHVIRVVIFQDGDIWRAQCLEYDIGTHAQTIDELKPLLKTLVEIEARISKERNGAPFAGIARAPGIFWLMHRRCAPPAPRVPFWDRVLRWIDRG